MNLRVPQGPSERISNRRYNCAGFALQLVAVSDLDAILRPAFIPRPGSRETHRRSWFRSQRHDIHIVLIRTKKRIPGGAVRRNRAGRRAFEAFKTCIQRLRMARKLRSLEDVVAVLIPTEEALTQPMENLVIDAAKALRALGLGTSEHVEKAVAMASPHRQQQEPPPPPPSSKRNEKTSPPRRRRHTDLH